MAKKFKLSSSVLFVYVLLGMFVLGNIFFQKNCIASVIGDANTVGLTIDTKAMTATMYNKYISIKFNNSGVGYSLIKDGKELIGSAKGFYSSVDAKYQFAPISLKIVTNTADMVDIAYISGWGELHYVMRSGISGVYSYFVTDNMGKVSEFRTLYRFDGNIFKNGYNSIKSGALPTIADINSGTKLQDETYKFKDGTVYSKYDWADYESRDHLHGLYGNGYGAWVIPASNEYYNGGPMRQELMVHTESKTGDGVLLNMLKGSHYGVGDVTIPKHKLYGPWLVYINNGDISDAKEKASEEEKAWPYNWLNNPNYPLSRTTVSGKLNINGKSTQGATIVLAKPGNEIYSQGEDYIFYSNADSSGSFSIPNVRPGSYTLYAYTASGDITDQFQMNEINVAVSNIDLGNLNWTPTLHPNFLWKIGNSDRMSSEFKLGNLDRQYGLPEKVPASLDFTIGTSTDSNDWYYAQTKVGTWNVNFNLTNTYNGNAYLTISTASAARKPEVDVYINGKMEGTLDYSVENDATTYRSANQSGRYRNAVIKFPSNLLNKGNNTIIFTMRKVDADGGIMYDIIKLETD